MLVACFCADLFDQVFDFLSFVFVADEGGVFGSDYNQVLHAD